MLAPRASIPTFLVALVAVMVVSGPTARAQESLSMSVASDILFPVSNFADVYNNGFGGNIQWRYSLGSAFQIGLTTGFFSWAVKEDQPVTDLKGVPARALAKLNFAAPMYLLAEGGAFVWWTTGEPQKTSTDFNYAIGFGVEPRLSKDGDIRFDASLRYEGVARDASPITNVVLRVGVTFTLVQ
jgi:uncharacterized membrane protein